jgi:hypothetical protein
MDKLKINLIPPEIKAQAQKEVKRLRLFKISVGLLGLLIFFTVCILSVIIYQGAVLRALDADLESEKVKIAALKDKEAVVFFLKNRIDTINQYSFGHYVQGEVYELINKLTPREISLTSLLIDDSELVSIQGNTTSTDALNTFFSNLIDPKLNEGKIVSVSVESLTKTQGSNIGFSLSVNMAGGKPK